MSESESEPTSEEEQSTEEESKEQPSKEKATEEKPLKKKVKSFDKALKKRFGKWGYTTVFDYIVFIAGLYGFGWYFYTMITAFIILPFITLGTSLYWIIDFIILIMITFFPFFSKLVLKMHEKWPNFMPLSFINKEEHVAKFILYLDWWSTLILWWTGTQMSVFLVPYAFWWWGLIWILLTIALFSHIFKRG